jgi:hypothetical protein
MLTTAYNLAKLAVAETSKTLNGNVLSRCRDYTAAKTNCQAALQSFNKVIGLKFIAYELNPTFFHRRRWPAPASPFYWIIFRKPYL